VNGDDLLVIGPGSVRACFWSFLHMWCRVLLECRPRNTLRAIIPSPAEFFLFMADFSIECLHLQSSHITLDNDLAIYFSHCSIILIPYGLNRIRKNNFFLTCLGIKLTQSHIQSI
jgi:hypothetical protein